MDRTGKKVVVMSELVGRLIRTDIRLKQCYLPHTTSIIRYGVDKQIGEIRWDIYVFTDKEMELFVEFYNGNTDLHAVGFNDSSALFYALVHDLPVVVTDGLTERICHLLKVKTVSLEEVEDRQTMPSDQNVLVITNYSINNDGSRLSLNLQKVVPSYNKREYMTG